MSGGRSAADNLIAVPRSVDVSQYNTISVSPEPYSQVITAATYR
jgi:hypothetical protein